MRLLLAIAAFEFRQQLRSHVFWIVFAISAMMVAGAVWTPELRVGLSTAGTITGDDFAIRTHLVWTLFYLFTAAAFSAEAVLRDDQTGFGPLIGATPVPRRSHVFGRFLGAYLATTTCYLSVPLALQFAARGDPAANLYGLVAFGLPNLLLASAIFLVLAALARSLLGAMLGAVALLALYGAGVGGGEGWAILEPFGFAAYAEATAGWPAAEQQAETPAFAGPILLNRLFWTGFGLAVMALLVISRPTLGRGMRARAPAAVETVETSRGRGRARDLPPTRHGPRTSRAQYAARTRLELQQVLATPVFAILLLLGLGHAGSVLWQVETNAAPDELLRTLAQAFQLTPTVVALFFAGELYWAERDRRVHDLIAATAIPSAALFLPKLIALCLALLGLALASAAAAMLVPAVGSGVVPGLGQVLFAYVIPKWFDWTLVGALALFFQALSPNKLAGWGLMVLYLIASLTLELTGFTNPLYRYGEYPTYPVPEPLAGDRPSAFRLYWAAVALLLTAAATRLAGRAGHDPLRIRLRRFARAPAPRLRGRATPGHLEAKLSRSA